MDYDRMYDDYKRQLDEMYAKYDSLQNELKRRHSSGDVGGCNKLLKRLIMYKGIIDDLSEALRQLTKYKG